LRGFVDGGGKNEIGDAGQEQIGEVVDGASPASVGAEIGEVSVEGVVKRIKQGIRPELADGSGRTPLDKTGHLIDSIAWRPL
jgi:hypothetical protein